jgi:hypothetical protein
MYVDPFMNRGEGLKAVWTLYRDIHELPYAKATAARSCIGDKLTGLGKGNTASIQTADATCSAGGGTASPSRLFYPPIQTLLPEQL